MVGARVAAFVAFVFFARSLGPEGLAVIALAWSVAVLAFELGEGGVDPISVRALTRARAREAERLGAALAAKVLYTTPGLVIALGVVAVSVDGPTRRVAAAVIVAAGWIGGLGRSLAGLFQARERFAYRGALELARSLVLMLGAVAVWATDGGLLAVGVAYAAAETTGASCSLLFWAGPFGALRPRPRRRSTAVLVRAAAWPALAAFLMVAYLEVDRIVLWFLGEAAELGVYDSLVRVVLGLTMVPASLAAASLPAIASRDRARARRLYADGTRVLAALGAPLGLGGAALAPELLGLLYGPEFAATGRPFAWLWFAAGGLIYLSYLPSTSLLALGQTRRLAAITGALAATNLILNLLLVPGLGARGAAAATLACQGVGLVAYTRAVAPTLGPFPWGAVARAGLAAAVCAAAARATPGPVPLRVAAGAVVYLGALVAVGGLPASALRGLREDARDEGGRDPGGRRVGALEAVRRGETR